MPSFNQTIILGHMTRDPQLKYTPANTAVCEFGIAQNHKWKDKAGNAKEDVLFVDCSCFGTTAEMVNKYFAKGRAIMVVGRLKFDQWTAQDGTKRSKHSIMVERVDFVDGPAKSDTAGSGATSGASAQVGGNAQQTQQRAPNAAARPSGAKAAPPDNSDLSALDSGIPEADIPF